MVAYQSSGWNDLRGRDDELVRCVRQLAVFDLKQQRGKIHSLSDLPCVAIGNREKIDFDYRLSCYCFAIWLWGQVMIKHCNKMRQSLRLPIFKSLMTLNLFQLSSMHLLHFRSVLWFEITFLVLMKKWGLFTPIEYEHWFILSISSCLSSSWSRWNEPCRPWTFFQGEFLKLLLFGLKRVGPGEGCDECFGPCFWITERNWRETPALFASWSLASHKYLLGSTQIVILFLSPCSSLVPTRP